jgi:hypothetical protein
MAMPKYFDHFGVVEPNNRFQSVVAFVEGKLGSTAYEIYHKDEEHRTTFTMAMGAYEGMIPSLGSYDLRWAVEEALQAEDRVLIVDVGGGKGNALVEIFKATPAIPRHRCVLEDLLEVVAVARQGNPELADVQMVAIDFHKEQPVKGAVNSRTLSVPH